MRHVFPLFALAFVGCAPFFTLGENTKSDAAIVKAETLLTAAKAYSIKNDDKKLESLDDLTSYCEDGEKALLDPWGKPFQFKYVNDPETETERIIIWTTDPQSGRIIASPQHLAPLIDHPN